MPYPTLTKNLKLRLSPGLVASYDIQSGNGVICSEIHIHLLAYLLAPDPHGTHSSFCINVDKHATL